MKYIRRACVFLSLLILIGCIFVVSVNAIKTKTDTVSGTNPTYTWVSKNTLDYGLYSGESKSTGQGGGMLKISNIGVTADIYREIPTTTPPFLTLEYPAKAHKSDSRPDNWISSVSGVYSGTTNDRYKSFTQHDYNSYFRNYGVTLINEILPGNH